MQSNRYLLETIEFINQGNSASAKKNLPRIRGLSYSSQHEEIIQLLLADNQFPALNTDNHEILSQLLSDRAFAKALLLHFCNNRLDQPFGIESNKNEQATYLFSLLTPYEQTTFVNQLNQKNLQDDFFKGFKNRPMISRVIDYMLAVPLLPLKLVFNALDVVESIGLFIDGSDPTALLRYMSMLYLAMLIASCILTTALILTMPLLAFTLPATILTIQMLYYGIAAIGTLGLVGVAAITASVAAIKMVGDSVDRFKKENLGHQDFIKVCSDNGIPLQQQRLSSGNQPRTIRNGYRLFCPDTEIPKDQRNPLPEGSSNESASYGRGAF